MADAKIAIYLTPTATADSIPFMLGTKHGYDVPYFLLTISYNYFELAICGTHFGETKDPTSTALSPALERLLIKVFLSYRVMICFSFCRPSLGPTSTIFTNSPLGWPCCLTY